MGSILVVAQSARLLAQSARRGGWCPLALDGYGDADTAAVSGYWEVLPESEGGFRAEALLAAARRADPDAQAEGLVYGTGLENRPDLVELLTRRWRVLGNCGETLKRVREPAAFFSLLDELEIAYPETRFTPPDDCGEWLTKGRCGEGGKEVFPFEWGRAPAPGDYFQRRIQGANISVLILADGRNFRIVGFSTQWCAPSRDRPFLFGGIASGAVLPVGQRRRVEMDARKVVACLALVGMNSLDYIYDGDICHLLEINPRPGASLSLYDNNYEGGLLRAHVQSCRGVLPDGEPQREVERGYQVVYAPDAVTIPEDFPWPAWCADRPIAGTVVEEGAPVCTISAAGLSRENVMADLSTRERELRRRLFADGQASENVSSAS